jgi:trimeric autotransporter adhesin
MINLAILPEMDETLGSAVQSGDCSSCSSTIQPQQQMKTKNMTTLHLRKSISRSPLRVGFVLIPLALACFVLAPAARAVDPPPDGGYPNQTTAEGDSALFSLTTGDHNTAVGFSALFSNTTGFGNIANGAYALYENTTGRYNTANGDVALSNNITGGYNTAVGGIALASIVAGNNNTALGYLAGNNLSIGSNNIDIGNAGVADDAGIIRIGTAGTQTATFVAGIRETPLAVGVAVGITVDGQLGVRASSARFKSEIKPMDKASDAIFSLKPVTFHYKKNLDPKGIPQFGLVAEDVAKVAPDLVACDTDGKPFTVRYDEVNAMLLNEFLKEHVKVEEQAGINQRQEAAIARLEAALKEQAAQIQKVSDQIELTKPRPQVVVNQ